jgi:thiamine-phosphate pyrophosphorylase
MNSKRSLNLSVYFVADPACCAGRTVTEVIERAVMGGVTMVQLRDKTGQFKDALAVRDMLRPLHIPFIINDDVHFARDIGADGVHVGQGDMSAAEARAIMGPDAIIGVTAYEPAHFDSLDPDMVDYAGTGPFFPTLTKPGKPVLGAEGFRKLVDLSPVPVVGIGGVTPDNAGEVIRAGAAGVAMMRSISENPDPKAAADCVMAAVIAARLKRAS